MTIPTKLNLRRFDPERDYPTMANLRTQCFPLHPISAEDFAADERGMYDDPDNVFHRWILEIDGQDVGMCSFFRMMWNFHPHRFRVVVQLLPPYQSQGLGTMLYAHLMEELAPYDPQTLIGILWEGNPQAMQFALKNGFVETSRTQESELDLTTFDATRFDGVWDKLAEHGIEIHSVADLLETDRDVARKLYDLDTQTMPDVPSSEPFTQIPFEKWVENYFEDPLIPREGYLVATHQGEYVGLSHIWLRADSSLMLTGFTGVRSDYRRKGIALALKLKIIEYSKSMGKTAIRTNNDKTNVGMLAVNEQLGFVALPAFIDMRKYIKPESPYEK